MLPLAHHVSDARMPISSDQLPRIVKRGFSAVNRDSKSAGISQGSRNSFRCGASTRILLDILALVPDLPLGADMGPELFFQCLERRHELGAPKQPARHCRVLIGKCREIALAIQHRYPPGRTS